MTTRMTKIKMTDNSNVGRDLIYLKLSYVC